MDIVLVSRLGLIVAFQAENLRTERNKNVLFQPEEDIRINEQLEVDTRSKSQDLIIKLQITIFSS